MWLKVLGVSMGKDGYIQSGDGTLKLTLKWSDGTNWFFARNSKINRLKNKQIKKTDFLHAGTDSGKLKVVSMILGWV